MSCLCVKPYIWMFLGFPYKDEISDSYYMCLCFWSLSLSLSSSHSFPSSPLSYCLRYRQDTHTTFISPFPLELLSWLILSSPTGVGGGKKEAKEGGEKEGRKENHYFFRIVSMNCIESVFLKNKNKLGGIK